MRTGAEKSVGGGSIIFTASSACISPKRFTSCLLRQFQSLACGDWRDLLTVRAIFFQSATTEDTDKIDNASKAALVGRLPFFTPYCLHILRHRVINIAKTAALENQIAGYGAVRVNAVCPGFIQTAMSQPFRDVFRQLVSNQKFVQMGVPSGSHASSVGYVRIVTMLRCLT